MNVPIKFWFNKNFLWVFGVAAVIFAVIIAVLVGVDYLNTEKPVYTQNSYGGQHIRVKSDKGAAQYPPELPADFIPLYENAKLHDIWIDMNGASEFLTVDIIYTTSAAVDKVIAFYREKFGADYELGNNNFMLTLHGMRTTVYIKPVDGGAQVEFDMKRE